MNQVIVIGNLGRDPELSFSNKGTAVCKISVGTKERGRDGGEDILTWHKIVIFNELAENVAASASKGDRVIVIGQARKQQYEKKDGTTAWSDEIRATDVGLNLRFTAATPLRANASDGSARQAKQVSVDSEEEPF